MTLTDSGARRVFVGKEIAVVFGLFLAGSALIQTAFLPAYLAVLFASGLRNVYFAWLGNGILFWTVALVGLYLQAVVVTAGYLAVRTAVRSLRGDSPGESSL
jgi:hypothetical protein